MHPQDTFNAGLGIEPQRSVPQQYTAPRGSGSESAEIRRQLAGFNPTLSPVAYTLRQLHPGVTKYELISIADLMVSQVNEQCPTSQPLLIRPDRTMRRSMDLIIKWYHDNWGID
jgi:hypothetical protein